MRFHSTPKLITVSRRIAGMVVCTGVLSVITVAAVYSTEAPSLTTHSDKLTPWLAEFLPPENGRPPRTGNGSSRRPLTCSPDEPMMTAFMPEGHYGLTLKENPEIFIDIPETSAQHVSLEFRHLNSEEAYQAFLPIPEETGIVGFRLPEDVGSLPSGETYQWFLTFVCGDFLTLNDPVVMGWVQRTTITPEILQQLNNPSPQAQAQWLRENGYWYDLVDLAVTQSAQAPIESAVSEPHQ